MSTAARPGAAVLPALREGKITPTSVEDRLDFAWLLQQPRWSCSATSVRLYASAFAAEPAVTADPRQQFRYHAACAAALAGTGQGKDVAGLDDPEKTALRRRALEWLTADLTFWSRQAHGRDLQERFRAQQILQRWRRNHDLAAVRDPASLAKLPPSERADWQKLWQAVTEK